MAKNQYFNKKYAIMKQASFLLLLALLTVSSHGQSLVNTNWKTYIGDPVNDSITLHIRPDSSLVTLTNGTVVVRTHCKVAGDTLSLDDYDGQYMCPNAVGRYKISRTEDVLSLKLIDDPCDGRAQSLSSAKWRKVPD
jgi:hypothetical protein